MKYLTLSLSFSIYIIILRLDIQLYKLQSW